MVFIIATSIANQHPPQHTQVNHELTCYTNYEGYEGEEYDQEKDRGGVCREGWRDRGEDKGGKNQLDEERVCGVFPGCGREE